MDIRFCYRISAEAKMAHDEHGTPAETFVQVKLDGAKKSPTDYDASSIKIGKSLATQIGVDPKWITPISTEEYDKENAEEDEDLCPHGDEWDDCPDCRH